VNSPGLQSVNEKESEEEAIKHSAYPAYILGLRSQDDEVLWEGKICGLPKMWFFILAALVLLLSLPSPQHWTLSWDKTFVKLAIKCEAPVP
jgi:hypothetical protein